jgi:2-hydroxy-6-oxonona-2,4-dienedioate hydrolase
MRDEAFSKAEAGVFARHGLTIEQRWLDSPAVGGHAHVLATGDGPPVVLLNGGGVPAAMLAPLMARLEGVTQYAVDLPGFGLTDVNPEFAHDLRHHAVTFLAGVLDDLGIDRAVIVANSFGALCASWLAIDAPDRVSALGYIGCPAVILDTSAPLPMRLLGARGLGPLMMKLQPPSERQVEQLARMVREHPLPPEIATLILATERLPHFQDAFLGLLNRLVGPRGSRPGIALTEEDLASIAVPALLVFARNDPMGGEAVGVRVAEAMPDAELHVVDGGHAPWVHHADQIGPLVDSFLRRIRAAVPRRNLDLPE